MKYPPTAPPSVKLAFALCLLGIGAVLAGIASATTAIALGNACFIGVTFVGMYVIPSGNRLRSPLYAGKALLILLVNTLRIFLRYFLLLLVAPIALPLKDWARIQRARASGRTITPLAAARSLAWTIAFSVLVWFPLAALLTGAVSLAFENLWSP